MKENNSTRKHWGTTSDADLHNQLKELSTNTRIPFSKLIDEAIEDLLLKHGVIEKKTKTP